MGHLRDILHFVLLQDTQDVIVAGEDGGVRHQRVRLLDEVQHCQPDQVAAVRVLF